MRGALAAFAADYERRCRQLAEAAAKLDALAARVEFARARMLFAAELRTQQQQQPHVPDNGDGTAREAESLGAGAAAAHAEPPLSFDDDVGPTGEGRLGVARR